MILNKIALILFFLFISTSAYCLNATLTPFDVNKNLVEEGSIFLGKLSFEGEEPSETDWSALNKDEFSNYFLFMESEKTKDNEYKVRLLLKEVPPPGVNLKSFIGPKEVDLKITGFHLATTRNVPKDYKIQDQDLGWKRIFKKEFLYGALVFITLVSYPSFLFFRKIYRKKKKAAEKKFKQEYWQSYFYSAQGREQFEEIGKRKKEWLALLKDIPSECQSYFNVLESYQYKKEMTAQELQELKQALNGMKDVIQRNGI